MTNLLALPWLAVLTAVPPSNTPFSRSASTHGPCPVLPGALSSDRFSASMWLAPVSVSVLSTLPKSEQQPLLMLVPLATSYMVSGWPLVATPAAFGCR